MERIYNKPSVLEFILNLIINTCILMLATKIFKGFYISSIWYAVLSSLIISLLNETVKPILVVFFLPITVYTLGLFYPLINVIILKLTGVLLGNNFIINGLIVPIFISMFIWFMKILCNIFIINPIMLKRR
ncbi:MAG: phage holin family protein [Bacilli bacterium]|nr:phage holin family protein [Bacilli bacterium]